MTNPFDDPEAMYLVVSNAEDQHALWPAFLDIPAGWHSVFGAGDRAACLAAITDLWTDLRPASLRRSQAAPREIAAAPREIAAAPREIAAAPREIAADI